MYMTNWRMLVKGYVKGKKKTQLFGRAGIQSQKWKQVEPEDMNTQTSVQALAFRPLLSQHYLCGIRKNKKTAFKDWISEHGMTLSLHFVQDGDGGEKYTMQPLHLSFC